MSTEHHAEARSGAPDTTPTELILAHATILPVDGRQRSVADAWLRIRDGRIAEMGTGEPPADAPVRDLSGLIVAPGFVSSHSHLATTVARGQATESRLYDWAAAMYAITAGSTVDDIYWATLHGSFDLLRNGVTCAFDFPESRLPWTPIGQEAEESMLRPLAWSTRQFDAKRDSGIRSVHAIRLDDKVGDEAAILARFAEMLAYIESVGDPLARGAIYGAAQWSDDERSAGWEAALMAEHALVNQAHLLETPVQLERQRERFGWYEKAGALGPLMVFGHLVHPTPEIVDAIAESGSAVSWQPAANGRLGSGIADIPTLREKGVRVGLGLDDQACTDIADPWQNMRMGMFMARARAQDAAAVSVEQVLRHHTLGAAEVIGMESELGSIEVGKLADLVVVDPRRPDIGPVRDPLAAYVLSCSTRNIESVIVGGRTLVEGDAIVDDLAERASVEVHARFEVAS